ncbi:MAG TPA: hypothetical protein VJM50_23470 [Pyrinomonadaceae bacterium]|nr:hypothetical protein [Pyrinomonadaceae bacterium]
MAKKILLLIIMSFSLAVSGFWALKAQDPPQTPRTDPPTVAAQQTTQTDLSGTYTGTFNCEPLGLTGETTLTITGNEFTTADGKSGRIVASTTGGYTAVAFQMGTLATTVSTTPAPAPVIVSMRARKTRDRLILTPAPGTAMKCSFTPGRGVARGKRTPKTPAATGTEVAAPATPTESPTPSQTPEPSPSPTGSPTPEPSPTPSGSPTPAPSPTPSGSPTPTPSPSEPAPSPTPTPSPSPTPRPVI